MGKLTFRADDDLVDRLETLDVSKSQVIREALRRYLDDGMGVPREPSGRSELAEALDRAIDDRVAARLDDAATGSPVNVIVETPSPVSSRSTSPRSGVPDPQRRTRCHACGESTDVGHGYCPHCGAERGDEACSGCGHRLRDGWAFCPNCGCRTLTPDVLDRS